MRVKFQTNLDRDKDLYYIQKIIVTVLKIRDTIDK